MNLLYLLLGWLFGLLSPQIVRQIEQRYRRAELTRTLLRELGDLQYRMALTSWHVRSKHATVNQAYVAWLRPLLRSYDGPDRNARLIESLEQIANLSDPELKILHEASREQGRTARGGKFHLPFLASQIHQLTVCALDFQQRVLQVKLHLDLYNDQVEYLMRNHDRTFDSAIVGPNRDRLLAAIAEEEESLSRRAEQIASRVGEIRQLYERNVG